MEGTLVLVPGMADFLGDLFLVQGHRVRHIGTFDKPPGEEEARPAVIQGESAVGQEILDTAALPLEAFLLVVGRRQEDVGDVGVLDEVLHLLEPE